LSLRTICRREQRPARRSRPRTTERTEVNCLCSASANHATGLGERPGRDAAAAQLAPLTVGRRVPRWVYLSSLMWAVARPIQHASHHIIRQLLGRIALPADVMHARPLPPRYIFADHQPTSRRGPDPPIRAIPAPCPWRMAHARSSTVLAECWSFSGSASAGRAIANAPFMRASLPGGIPPGGDDHPEGWSCPRALGYARLERSSQAELTLPHGTTAFRAHGHLLIVARQCSCPQAYSGRRPASGWSAQPPASLRESPPSHRLPEASRRSPDSPGRLAPRTGG
jgi:hypothetical protein